VLLVLAAVYVHSPWQRCWQAAILWPFIFIADMYF
jgi:hypothetical protein